MTADDYWTPARRRGLAIGLALLLGGFLAAIGWPWWLACIAGAVCGGLLW